MLFSPEAHEADQQVMQGHWEEPEGDDFASADRRYWVSMEDADALPAPTRKQLLRHLDRFMPTAVPDALKKLHTHAVEEVAAMYGITLVQEGKPTRPPVPKGKLPKKQAPR